MNGTPNIDRSTQTVTLSDGSVWTQFEIESAPELFIKACARADSRTKAEPAKGNTP